MYYSTAEFASAKDNMAYDNQLFARLQTGKLQRFLRFYNWQHIAVTHSYKQPLPESLTALDTASRLTGGGIVFHNPNDVVFSLGATLDDTLFPKRFKDKMATIAQDIADAIQAHSHCHFDLPPTHHHPNIQFCNSYYSPYEYYVAKQKVLGLALRRKRKVFMAQGIIHLQSNFVYFKPLEACFGKFFTAGLGKKIKAQQLMSYMQAKWNAL